MCEKVYTMMMISSKLAFVWKVAFLQMIAGVHGLNSLTSIPSQVNGTLVACVGDEISLTCSHDRVGSVATQWIISSPVNCSTSVSHNPQTPVPPPCGPFSFQNITIAEGGVAQLNSTAVAIVNSSTAINGSIVECKAAINMPVSVGNISLCVVDELPEPVNLRCLVVPRGLLVTWDVVTDGSSSCARSSIIHNVTVVREADGIIIVSVDDIVDTQIEITDSSLEPRQNYSIHIGTRLLQGTCETGEAANIVCKMSDDLSPTTTPPAPDPGSSYAPIVAPVVVVVVVIITMITVITLVVVLLMTYRHKHNESDPNAGRPQVEHPQTSDPLYTEIPDTEADLELATHQNIAYLDINSTRSQKLNRNANVSVSMARSALGTTNEGQLYTEIPELGDEKLSSTEIPLSQNVAYLDLKHVN